MSVTVIEIWLAWMLVPTVYLMRNAKSARHIRQRIFL